MTPLTFITLAGMLMATGLVLAYAALRPAPPRLSAALAQLSAEPTSEVWTGPRLRNRWSWIPARTSNLLEAHVGVGDEDLSITETTRAELTARKLSRAGAGLVMPALTSAALALLGVQPPVVFPVGFALLLAAMLWVATVREVRAKAVRARLEFRAALRSFLTLVAQERAARGSPAEALEEASRVWKGWAFQLIHTEVLRAELAGEQPWNALRNLGIRLGVDELRVLADIVATAADGAAVFDTLLAETRSFHHAELAAQQATANADSERLVQPISLLAIGFVLLLLLPPLLRLFTT